MDHTTQLFEDEAAMRAIVKVYSLLFDLAAKKRTTGTGDTAPNQPPVPADSTIAPSRDEAKG